MRVLLTLVLGLLAPLAQAVELRDVRLWDGPDSTRIVFDLEGATAHRSFTLENPNRLVIDLNDAKLAQGVKLDGLGKGIVKGVRTGPREGGLRVVLDLGESASPKSFGLEPNGQYGYRLIFDLYGKTPAVAPTDQTALAVVSPAPSPPPASPSVRAPVVAVDPRLAQLTPYRPIVIAIDPGHGGEDPGARGKSGVIEKDVSLRISKKLAKLVNETPGYKAVLTRTGDYYVGLRERTGIARKAQADLFVSIHANSLPVARNVRGSAVYVLSQRGATSEHAKMRARGQLRFRHAAAGVHRPGQRPAEARRAAGRLRGAEGAGHPLGAGRDRLPQPPRGRAPACRRRLSREHGGLAAGRHQGLFLRLPSAAADRAGRTRGRCRAGAGEPQAQGALIPNRW